MNESKQTESPKAEAEGVFSTGMLTSVRKLSGPLLFFSALSLWACDKGTMMPDPETQPDPLTDLDRYVKTKDPSYSWKLRMTDKGSGYTAYFIDMKSLTWRTPQEVDRTQWQHDLTIIRPDNLSPGPAVLAISGGSNGTPPTKAPDDMVQIAKATNALVINLSQVPNEPLTFANHDGKSHTEDGIVAFSWAQVMKTQDPTWTARFPMVKSAVLAMDTTQEFLRTSEGGNLNVEKFIVAGASKRGWTTWLTAAVDSRVAAAIPIVIDVLNVDTFMRQHVETYGFWAKALYDYHYNHITSHIGTPEMAFMLKNEDPYLFRKRLTMPKFVINASGDQFFLPDGSQNYFADLAGEKYLRYVPNGDHGLDDTDAVEGAVAFVGMLREGRQRPAFSFAFEGPSSIRVTAGEAPQKVLLWQAEHPKARDFRVETLGKVWKSSELTSQGGGVYIGKIDPPTQGYRAFLIEAHFASGQIFPFKVSSAVRILPDTRPYASIDPKTAPLETVPTM